MIFKLSKYTWVNKLGFSDLSFTLFCVKEKGGGYLRKARILTLHIERNGDIYVLCKKSGVIMYNEKGVCVCVYVN